MWNNVLHLFQEYMGTGLLVIWFLVAVIYLLFTEKRKHIRILFVYVPIMLLILFFNPFFAAVIYQVAGDEIYYRIIWLMPITVVIAFAVIEVWSRQQGMKKAAFAIVSAVIVMISGSYIYRNPHFQKAENLYHVPQSVVDICDAIEVEGREVMAVFPAELLQYVRQYSPRVRMPYGRDILVSKWIVHSELYDAIEAEEVNVKAVSQLARAQNCHYIIISEKKILNGVFADYDYDKFGQMHGYVIYKDSTVDLTSFQNESTE